MISNKSPSPHFLLSFVSRKEKKKIGKKNFFQQITAKWKH